MEHFQLFIMLLGFSLYISFNFFKKYKIRIIIAIDDEAAAGSAGQAARSDG